MLLKKGRETTKQEPLQVLFNIGSVHFFERKLKEAQKVLRIDPQDYFMLYLPMSWIDFLKGLLRFEIALLLNIICYME